MCSITMEQSKIIATTNDLRAEYGTAEIRYFNSKDVLLKSLQNLFMFWGLALLSVFLPVVHFILVPLFLILGVFLSVRARKVRGEFISGQVACPRCGTVLTIKHAVFIDRIKEICQNCAVVINVEVVVTATESGPHQQGH